MAADDVVDMLATALTTGAAAGLKETATAAVKDAYADLLAALRRRLGGKQTDKLVALTQDQATAQPEPTQQVVKALAETDAATDGGIVTAARALLAEVDPAGTRAGKYNVNIQDVKGVQVGDGNTMRID